ncbi:MAG: hypothetical protein JNM28_13020 [Armatimonadetes bacterium]|nr:hypothetical protein [Armatimonadota bacterium]
MEHLTGADCNVAARISRQRDIRPLLKSALALLVAGSTMPSAALSTTGWMGGTAPYLQFPANSHMWGALPTPVGSSNGFVAFPPATAPFNGISYKVEPIATEGGRPNGPTGFTTYLLDSGGYVFGCGIDDGMLGNQYPSGFGGTGGTLKPVMMPNGTSPVSDVIAIASSAKNTTTNSLCTFYMLKVDGTVALCANQTGNAVFNGTLSGKFGVTTLMANPSGAPFRDVKAITSTGSTLVMLKTDGTVWLAGNTTGFNVSGPAGYPQQLRHTNNANIVNIKGIAAGFTHIVLLASSGNVACIGRNDNGAIGGTAKVGWDANITTSATGTLAKVKKVEATQSNCFALMSDGQVFAWGLDHYGTGASNGLLGTNAVLSTDPNISPKPYYQSKAKAIPGLSNVVDIWSSVHTMYAILADGTIRVWGDKMYLPASTGSSGFSSPWQFTSHPTRTSGVLSGSGGGAGLLIQGTGRPQAWGRNKEGQAGTGGTIQALATPTVTATPVKLQTLPFPLQLKHIAGGQFHSVGIGANGMLFTVGGENANQALGNGPNIQSSSTWNYATGQTSQGVWIDADVEGATTYALRSNGKLYGFGLDPLRSNPANPPAVHSLTQLTLPPALNSMGVISVKAGAEATLALSSDGTVWALGGDTHGEKGDGPGNPTGSGWSQVKLANGNVMNMAIAIDIAGHTAYALLSSGQVMAWGANQEGQCGNGAAGADQDYPAASGATSVKMISAGTSPNNTAAGHCVYLTGKGNVFISGSNLLGQLGNGTASATGSAVPQQVVQIPSIKEISAGLGFTTALTAGGMVYAWGNNSQQMIGFNSTVSAQPSPVPVSSGLGVRYYRLGIGSDRATAFAFTSSN